VHIQVHISYLQPVIFNSKFGQADSHILRSAGIAFTHRDGFSEHHLDQVFRAKGLSDLSHDPPLPQDCNATAESFHIFKLVRYKQDRFTLLSQQFQGGK
jgi:hypothetical protein